MFEKKGRSEGQLDTTPLPTDFPLGSIESRAAARAVMSAMSLRGELIPPTLITVYVGPNGEPCDFWRADVDGEIFDRLEGESIPQFKERIMDSFPIGLPRSIMPILPDDEAKEA